MPCTRVGKAGKEDDVDSTVVSREFTDDMAGGDVPEVNFFFLAARGKGRIVRCAIDVARQKSEHQLSTTSERARNTNYTSCPS